MDRDDSSDNGQMLRQLRRRRLGKIVLLILVAAGVVVVFLPSWVAPWSRMNNTERELDLFSGRVRTTRYFMWMHVGRHVEQTPVSKALGDDANRQERWVRTATFQPFHRVSPQYIHGRDPVAINHLASIWENHGFTPEAREKTARQLLRLLRGANVSAAKTWLDGLYELSEDRCPDQPVTAADIPDDLDEKALAAEAEDHQPNTSRAD